MPSDCSYKAEKNTIWLLRLIWNFQDIYEPNEDCYQINICTCQRSFQIYGQVDFRYFWTSLPSVHIYGRKRESKKTLSSVQSKQECAQSTLSASAQLPDNWSNHRRLTHHHFSDQFLRNSRKLSSTALLSSSSSSSPAPLLSQKNHHRHEHRHHHRTHQNWNQFCQPRSQESPKYDCQLATNYKISWIEWALECADSPCLVLANEKLNLKYIFSHIA